MKNVPNAITIARIVLTPVVLFLLFSESFAGRLGAFVVFVIAAISDYYDGKLARSYAVPSRLGQFLDPFADKILVLGTFTALALLIPHVVPWWAVALIAVRDLAVTLLRAWNESRGRSLKTLPLAKAKTTVQLTFLIATLLLMTMTKMAGAVGAYANWLLGSVIPFICLLFVVGFTVWTGVLYVLKREEGTS
ncbi:MAG: CDP-diacylglycerol--glycerol-3-phosphate 3-phosphatidyltransferase [Rhodothermales bacterium]|nr:CDP-diacylglycerol--glycerol-3-phosphate 3-phosphatidyltransferase [Rhodothermales bacterium]